MTNSSDQNSKGPKQSRNDDQISETEVQMNKQSKDYKDVSSRIATLDSVFFARHGLLLAILYGVLFDLGGAILGIFMALIAVNMGFVESIDVLSNPESIEGMIVLLVVNGVAVILMGVVVVGTNKQLAYTSSLKEQFPLKKNNFLLVGGIFLLMILIVGGFNYLTSFFETTYFPDFEVVTPYGFLESDNPAVLTLAIVNVVIIAPIVEELFYRWTIINALDNGMSDRATVLFSSLIFALAHSATNLEYSFYFFVIHLISSFLLGMFLGIVYLKTRKVLLTIILHAGWNFLISSQTFFVLANASLVYSIIFLVLIGVSAIFLGILIFNYFNNRKDPSKATLSMFIEVFRLSKKQVDNNNKVSSIDSKDERTIKMKWEWFELIGGYFLLSVLIPHLIQAFDSLIGAIATIILFFYLGALGLIGAIFFFRQINKINQVSSLEHYYSTTE
jgi:membrane protease YdiL (CAAX protease family)